MKVRSYLGLMAGVVLVPVILVLGYAIATLLDAERDAYLRSMREAARSTSLASDREWSFAAGSAIALRSSELLAANDLAGFFRQCQATVAGTDMNTALLDAGGRQLFNTARAYGSDIAAPSSAVQARISEVLGSSKPVVSNLIVGRATNRYIVTLEAPLTLPGGARYLLSQWFYADHFKLVFPKKDIPPEWLVAIFDREGRTIARSRGPEEFVGKFPLDNLRQAILAGGTPYFRNISRDGVALHTVLERSPTTGWTVAVGVPVEQIEASARRAVLLVGISLAGALAIALTAVFFLGRKLVFTINGATRSAILLGKRETPALAHSPVAEIDTLHAALHRVGSILEQYQANQETLLKQTQAARHRAEQQNQAKDDFLAMLGHELRNPLSAITAGVSLITMQGVSEASRLRAHEAISRQCGLLTNIVDELLDASRVMNGKVTLSKKVIDLGLAAQACMEALTLRGVAKMHVVTITLAPCPIEADPVRMDQIISNLLENAFKYTPAGGSVWIEAGPQDGAAVLRVRDTGVGIESDLMGSIFDVFVQGPARIDRAKGGLGIGLSVVQAMVTQHDGAVTAESDGKDCGSCFTVRIPLAPCDMREHATSLLNAADAGPTGSGRILLIDDNDDAREMLCELLLSEGFEVVQAGTGETGLKALDDRLISAAVIDIGLPDLSGFDVAARIRRDLPTRMLRLIALTGYGQDADRAKALAMGFDVFMSKPVQFDHLLAVLLQKFQGAPRAGPSE